MGRIIDHNEDISNITDHKENNLKKLYITSKIIFITDRKE